MPSGEIRMVHLECWATVGVLGNADYKNIRWGKAGRTRHIGIRPTVRGMAMNPVDHPHGGGEGRSKSGITSCNLHGVKVLKEHEPENVKIRLLLNEEEINIKD